MDLCFSIRGFQLGIWRWWSGPYRFMAWSRWGCGRRKRMEARLRNREVGSKRPLHEAVKTSRSKFRPSWDRPSRHRL
jgi:hypothetical protein